MTNQVTRRDFIKNVGVAGAAAAVLPQSLMAADEGGKTITLALVGGAHIHTPGFIKLLAARKDVRVKYVWDHDAARAEKRAQPLNAKVVAKTDEIWNDPEVLGVVICSETNRHLELVLAAVKARKHMFVEKPLGITGK